MMNGVRSITSDLPGVRQPVKVHRMGSIFPIGDADALARGILHALQNPQLIQEANTDFSAYDPDTTAAAYERLFNEITVELH